MCFVEPYAPVPLETPTRRQTMNIRCIGPSTQTSLRLSALLPGLRTLISKRVTAKSTKYSEIETSANMATIDGLKKIARADTIFHILG